MFTSRYFRFSCINSIRDFFRSRFSDNELDDGVTLRVVMGGLKVYVTAYNYYPYSCTDGRHFLCVAFGIGNILYVQFLHSQIKDMQVEEGYILKSCEDKNLSNSMLQDVDTMLKGGEYKVSKAYKLPKFGFVN